MFTHDNSYDAQSRKDEHLVLNGVTSITLLTRTIRYPISRDLILEKIFLSLHSSLSISDLSEVTFEERLVT